MNPQNLWIDETNAAEWAEGCRQEILAWFAPLAGKTPGNVEDFSVKVCPPTQENARQALGTNGDLTGEILISWGDTSFGLVIPMPFNGVFLSHRPGSSKGFVSVWTSWLAEAPSFRLIVPTSITKREKKVIEWRLGLPGGGFIGAPLAEPNAKDRKRLEWVSYFGDPSAYPEWLRPHLGIVGLRASGVAEKDSATVWQEILATHRQELGDPMDQDDLAHRILVTYPRWLKHRVARELRKAALGIKHDGMGAMMESVLAGRNEGNLDLARSVWEAVAARPGGIAKRLVFALHSNQSKEHADLVDPINPVDLAARITRVKRIALPASRLVEMPAEFRQNHRSFQGCLCPVDSPESGQVGLTLQLAAGARVDLDGRIQPAAEPAMGLGFGAGLVPFFAHNDGARNMMGAKNLRQAMPLRNPERPKIETGGEELLRLFTGPLVEIGACPGASLSDGALALGRDLLVAYLPWKGLNFEDAVVIGEQVVKQGMLDITLSRPPVRQPIPIGWVPRDAEENTVIRWSEGGLAKIGSDLFAGSLIARFVWEGSGTTEPMEIRHKDRTPAVLKSIRFTRRSAWSGGMLEYEIETPIAVKPGDKLMGRHGNKGVVGSILPTDQMPRFPIEGLPAGFPEELRGKPIDILLNPHGVISRMNLGQLLETHLGWVLHAGKHSTDDLKKDGSTSEYSVARAFEKTLDHTKVRAALQATGLDEYGRVRLVLPDGSETLSPVVVGFQHIVRLKHVPETKSQARRGGKNSLYSARTGQAVHGRRLGGGQRLGEMEEWALAAHGAHEVISEMLGIKSAAELAGAWQPEDGARQLEDESWQAKMDDSSSMTGNGFAPVLRDWLFALLLDSEENEHGGQRLSFADPERVSQYAGPWGEVTSDQGLTMAPAARFCCVKGGKKSPCRFELLGGEKIAFPSTAGGKGGQASALTLRDLLSHMRLRPSGALLTAGREFLLPLIDMRTGKAAPSLRVAFDFEPGSDHLKATVQRDGGKCPGKWPKELDEIALYGRFSTGEKKPNWSAEDLLTEFQKKTGRKRSVEEMRVTCSEHRSSPLEGAKPYHRSLQGDPCGLFDPMIFGDGLPTPGKIVFQRWGYISLPFEMPYPIGEISAKRASLPEEQLPKIRMVPVLPIRYRMPTIRGNSLVEDEIDRLGYSPLIRLCQAYRKTKEVEDAETDPDKKDKAAKHTAKIEELIKNQVGKLIGILAEALRGKAGLIRRHGLGRRVDRSARLVITPNPALKWDQVGIPTTVLFELMGDVVESWHPPQDAIDKEKPQSWRHPRENPEALEAATKLLKRFFAAHPDYVVLLNRQPSLHRDSFQAFHPVPLPPEAGEVIQLCPLACKGFAADNDGDEMVIHIPLSAAAQKEAARLLPSNNLFSLANRAPDNMLAHFDQDFVLGTWWIGQDPKESFRKRLQKLLPSDECRNLVAANGPISKEVGSNLLHQLAIRHAKNKEAALVTGEWMRLAFDACTQMGVSFGYYELLELAEQVKPTIADLIESPVSDSNKSLQHAAWSTLNEILKDCSDPGKPGLHLAAMALSGARGGKQVRQLIAARGRLEPGATGFQREENRFFFPSSLTEGVTPDEFFWAAMNARSSMCDKKLGTGHAGGLTRHLVFALRPHAIVSAECGNGIADKDRNPVTCSEPIGFCAKCYGNLPDGSVPAKGFPVGLVAAQSIGERGTQLSMQSFHAGERGINIQDVRGFVGAAKSATTPEFNYRELSEATDFVKKFQEEDAYSDLDSRHLQVLWTALHRAAKSLSDPCSPVTLSGTVMQGDPLDRIAYRDPDDVLAQAVLEGIDLGNRSSLAGLLL